MMYDHKFSEDFPQKDKFVEVEMDCAIIVKGEEGNA